MKTFFVLFPFLFGVLIGNTQPLVIEKGNSEPILVLHPSAAASPLWESFSQSSEPGPQLAIWQHTGWAESTGLSANIGKEVKEIGLGDLALLPYGEEGEFVLGVSQRRSLAALFGQELPLTLRRKKGRKGVEKQILLPAPMRVNRMSPNSDSLRQGLMLEWEIDSQSSEELILMLDYRPYSLGNAGFDSFEERDSVASLFPNRISYVRMIPDVGRYTFTQEDLASFREGMVIEMKLMRGRFREIKAVKKVPDFGVSAVSTFSHYFRLSY